MSEDPPPNTPVPALRPPPADLRGAITTPAPPSKTTDAVPALPDRTDEIIAAISCLGSSIENLRKETVDRDRMLADGLLSLDRTLREETNAKIDGVALQTRSLLEASHTLLDEWAKQTAYELDKVLDARVTELAGILRVVSSDVSSQRLVISEIGRLVLQHKADFSTHAPLVEKLAKFAYDLSKDDDDQRDRPTVTGVKER